MVFGFIKDAVKSAGNVFNDVKKGAGKAFDKVKGAAKKVIDPIDKVNDTVNKAFDKVYDVPVVGKALETAVGMTPVGMLGNRLSSGISAADNLVDGNYKEAGTDALKATGGKLGKVGKAIDFFT